MSTSNKKEAARYHHGNTRNAAILVGLELLERKGTQDISLRAVARKIGVTANALYRHFPDKEGFLKALADAGMERLARNQSIAIEGIEPGLESLQAAGLAYIELAIKNPALCRLMSKYAFPPIMAHRVNHEDLTPAAQLMRSHIEAAMPGGITEQQKHDASIRSWALVHGIAYLILEGQISDDLETAKRIMTTTVFWD